MDRRTIREKEEYHNSGQREGLPKMDRRTIQGTEKGNKNGQTEGLRKMDRRTIQEKEEDHHESSWIEEDKTQLMIGQTRMVEGEYSE
jgi:hypothetical protein